MKIIQSNAISLNSMIARSDGQEDWLPSEGWDEFVADAETLRNFIIGRETYELVMKLYPNYNFNNVEVPYKLIVTTQKDFAQPNGYIVVSSPEEAVQFLQDKGVQVGLLVGGGKLNSSFYSKSLIDETWVTINPIILGEGRSFITSSDVEIQLKLIDVIRLSKDRVQLKYQVIHRNQPTKML
jgi:dihydrofolate reductase